MVYTADNTLGGSSASAVASMLTAQNGAANQHQPVYVLTDDGANTYVWYNAHLDFNGATTLVATLVGVADCSTVAIGTNFQG